MISENSKDVGDSNIPNLKFAKIFRVFDRSLTAIKDYSEFESELLEEQHGLTNKVIEEYHGKYVNVIEIFKTLLRHSNSWN